MNDGIFVFHIREASYDSQFAILKLLRGVLLSCFLVHGFDIDYFVSSQESLFPETRKQKRDHVLETLCCQLILYNEQ